ncbi:MAG: hypothetical protein Q8R47_00220 [Nanoarchaeota archaeon]|nr:hypothetical protein [Nanoarchaeota archaeon]
MRKILPLAFLAACTYNTYNVDGKEGSEKDPSVNCDTALQIQWDCGLYVNEPDAKDPDFRQKLKYECETHLSGVYTLLDCITNSSCKELQDGKCDQYMPNY